MLRDSMAGVGAVKLSGPSGPGIRFIVGRPTRAVVTGIFPPEHPDIRALRLAVSASLADHQPAIDAALDIADRAWEHEIIYGKPGGTTPVGILNAASVTQRRIDRPLMPADLSKAVAQFRTKRDGVPSGFVLSKQMREAFGPARILDYGDEQTAALGIPLRVDTSLPPDVIGMETRCETCRGTGWARHSPWPCADCIGGKRLTLHRIAP